MADESDFAADMEAQYMADVPIVEKRVSKEEMLNPVTPVDGHEAIKDYLERMASSDEPAYSFGWPMIDEAFGDGVTKTEVILIGARTGVGKSWVLQQVLETILKAQEDTRAVLLTLEMSNHHMAERLLIHANEIAPDVLKELVKTEGKVRMDMVERNAPHLSRFGLIEQMVTLEQISTALDRAAERLGGPVDILAIDYLGLMRTGRGSSKLYEMVSEVSKKLKDLAKTRNIMIIIAAQLSRGGGGGGEIEPFLDSLRDSGVTEEAADRIVLMWGVPFGEEDDPGRQRINLKVAKNRFGSKTPPITLEFNEWMQLNEINPYELVGQGVLEVQGKDDIPF